MERGSEEPQLVRVLAAGSRGRWRGPGGGRTVGHRSGRSSPRL